MNSTCNSSPPCKLRLTSMTSQQFESFREMSCSMYARVSPYYRDMPFAVVIEQIKKDFDLRFAPEGFLTSGQLFLAIMIDSEQIGYFHFSEFPKGSNSVFGWNFHIFESYQHKGWGRKSAELAKGFLNKRGYNKIAINVVSDNEAAIKIYKSLGFQITQLNMEAKIF